MRMFKNGNKNAQKQFVPEENMLCRDITFTQLKHNF